ncbi:MAG TPA: class I SAM-dependent RNA methyltransferase [Anaerolineae bacterium]|nr:class I SAM-dependent RNA methyltransferase [Anaerolineae bacterium]
MSQRTQPPAGLVLHLDAMTYGGDAIGRAGGKAIFVRGGIAGETVRAQIVEDRGRFARAEAAEIVAPSPHRVSPRCRHFGFGPASCGGCHWQHVDYPAQLQFKTAVVREQLKRLGRIDSAPVRDTIPSPDVWAYRSHAEFSVTPDGRLGFMAARSNRIIPIDECHIVQTPILEWLRAQGQAEPGTTRVVVRSEGPAASVKVWQAHRSLSNLQPPISNLQFKGAVFQVSAHSFFQVNASLIETLVDQVVSRVAPRGGETVLDAYCGVGLFARFIAPVAERVIGIESSSSAIADARVNLGQFGGVDLREGPVEAVLPEIGEHIDAAIVDPPRAGCGPAVIAALIAKHVERLVYVSCDPSTLARDARQLLDGGYRLVEVQPLDMFPHTYHIECVAQFEA